MLAVVETAGMSGEPPFVLLWLGIPHVMLLCEDEAL